MDDVDDLAEMPGLFLLSIYPIVFSLERTKFKQKHYCIQVKGDLY